MISTILFFIFLLGQPQDIFLFSYFTGNGEDGLHLAYSTDGLTWKALKEGRSLLTPEVGKDKLMRDPCIIKGPDGLFHMVWTTGWWDRHIGYASSPDLICWSAQKSIPVMEHEAEAKNCWAPEVYYDNEIKEYLIFWATTIPGRHSEVPASDREKGLNHRIYYVTTPDFITFSETKLFFNPDFSVIDATLFKKENIFYMIVKNENSNPPEKNLRITSSACASGPYPVEVSEPITGNYWAEGPTCLQAGDYLYVYFDKYRDHRYGAIRSKDMEHWEDVSDRITFPPGIRHGTAFRVSKKLYKSLLKNLAK
ncbi:MAG: glycoside hydrolase family 43 protein [Bacteroidales bacterium]|nr:glycoside hydrolase family 43 protein [Bacteroidales bacterium]